MSEFTIHTIESAPEASKPALKGINNALGFVPNLFATFADAPAALEAYNSLTGILERSSLSPAEQQVVLIATSIENNCEYCVAAHSVIAKNMVKMDADIVNALRNDTPLPDAKLQALAIFTREVISSRGFVDAGQLQAFRAAGYSNAQAQEVVVGISLKVISNYVSHLANTPLDEAFAGEQWSASASSAA